MDELHGIFTIYEMRTEQENPDVKEASENGMLPSGVANFVIG
jgi:hypothetical protein